MLYIIDVIYLLILKSLHILKDKAPKVYVLTLGADFLSRLIKYFYLKCTIKILRDGLLSQPSLTFYALG